MQPFESSRSEPLCAGRFPPRVVLGVHLRLRLITPEDAAYVFSLRSDETYNHFLSAITGTVDDQRDWIKAYKAREEKGSEAYYVIERKDGLRCGLVRLYDIGSDSFTWGSWILGGNKPPKAALESAYLIYLIAFDMLGLSRAQFDVRRDNERTVAFHRRFGATQTHADENEVYFTYLRERFEADRAGFVEILTNSTGAWH